MVSVPALKTALQIRDANTVHDLYLDTLEKAAVEYVERKTGWYWGPPLADVDEVLEGDDDRVLWLAEPATAVSTVVERAYPGADETVIGENDDDGWKLRIPPGKDRGLKLVRQGGYVWTRNFEYVVTHTRGYASGTEPEDIVQAVTSLVVLWFEVRLPASVETGKTAVPRVPDHAAAIIGAHRKGRI